MLSSISVRTRISAAFLVVCLLIAGMGWSGLSGMSAMDEAIDPITRRDIVKLELAQEIALGASEASRLVDGMFLAEDGEEVRRLSAAVDGILAGARELAGRFEALGLDDADRAALGEVTRLSGEAAGKYQGVSRLLFARPVWAAPCSPGPRGAKMARSPLPGQGARAWHRRRKPPHPASPRRAPSSAPATCPTHAPRRTWTR